MGVYAGSLNGNFEGTTNIYISGNSTIPELYLGSIYNSIGVIKRQEVSYKGTINVYIAEDFTGTIGALEVASGINDEVTANIYLPDSSMVSKLPAIEGGSKVNLYINNEKISKEVTSITYEGETTVQVSLGTSATDIVFNNNLQIKCGDVTYIEDGIIWVCDSYDANTAGEYVFTTTLPECYNLNGTAMPTVTVQVIQPKGIIQAVDLPFAYTELYLNVSTPVFYDQLDCMVDGAVITIPGFTWESSDYKSNTPGTYTFTAIVPIGYKFADDLTIPTIRVRVKNKEQAANRVGVFFSDDADDTEKITGTYAVVKPSLIDTDMVQVYDITGFNSIRTSSNRLAAAWLAGGVDYKNDGTNSTDRAIGEAYALNPTELTAEIGVDGTSIKGLFGGSYCNIFKGTSNIYVKNGDLVVGVYAGSLNGDFEGTTNIYISGNSTIPELYLGSIYNTIGAIKRQEVSYKGTVNIYIADDFTGDIGKIVVPDGERDEIDANIYMSSACEFDIFSVGYEGATLYIDGQDASKYLSKVSYNGKNFIVVPFGTENQDLRFEGVLTVVYGGKEYTETDIEWVCENYSSNIPGSYVFTPVLPSEYDHFNEPVFPTVEVLVAPEDGIVIEKIDVGVGAETRIPSGVATLNTPTKAVITFTDGGMKRTIEIPIAYDLENYVPQKGDYTLSIGTVQDPFVLQESVAETAEIKVEVADITYEKIGDVYRIDNAMIKILAEERGNYAITDPLGIYTYEDGLTVIYAMEISGENPCLIIESPLVYVESDITFKNIRGNAEVNVAKSLVTKIRTEIPDNVSVNGVLLGSFDEKTVTIIVDESGSGHCGEKGVFYFNGIPGVIARGEDGGTYAYRSYDMKMLSEIDLAGWDVSGGSYGENSVTDITNVRFESGTVNTLYATGQGTTKDATLVLDGGVTCYSTFGGAMEGGTVLKTTVVYERGTSYQHAYVGGRENSVLGEPNKTYSDNEYVAEVWYFDPAITNFVLGARGGYVYGNVKFERHGGYMLQLNVGGDNNAKFFGDVEISMYSGILEKELVVVNGFYGNVRLKLYEGIHREEYTNYPTLKKENGAECELTVEYFSHPDDFQFTEYIDNRNEMVDTSEDAGKFIIRFLETKVSDGFEKGTVKIRQYTGDSIYITFPNGQNMLIDTGVQAGADNIIQDLNDLDVTKLDYLMISHQDLDHCGAIAEICEVFEVKHLLYPNVTITRQAMLDVLQSEGAEVHYLKRGDTFDIGGVHIDIINPEVEVTDESDNNKLSIAMVLTYGESKVFLGADCLRPNEKAFLEDEKILELISDCQLLKMNHHGIQNANCVEFLTAVNADKFVITNMREYGAQLTQGMNQVLGLGASLEDVYVSGKHGMIKAVIDNGGTVDMSCQYVKTTPYYADYSDLDTLLESVDESKLTSEGLDIWNEAVDRLLRGYVYEKQSVVDGLVAYMTDIVALVEEIKILSEGTDKSYTIGANGMVSIHCSGKPSELESVEMDDVIVYVTNYTISEGSTIVTFMPAYLETLSVGDHTVILNYSGGRSVGTTLTVSEQTTEGDDESIEGDESSEENESTETDNSTMAGNDALLDDGPDTGDMNSLARHFLLVIMATVVMSGYAFGNKRKKQR